MAEVNLKLNFLPTLAVAKLNVMIRAIKDALGPLGKDIKLIDVKKLESDMRTVSSSIKDARASIKDFEKALGEAEGKGKSFGKFFEFNQIVQGVQTAASAVNEFLSVGVQFEDSLAAVGAITGFSGDALNDLGERARTLAKDFGTSATDQLSAFQGILSKLGPQVAEDAGALELMARNVNTLSAASGDSAATSMSAIVDAMLQFGLTTGDAAKDAETSTRIINGLAASAQVGAAEIPQVAQAILQAGVAAKGANQSFEATNAWLQVLAVGGKTGSEAGVALRNVLGLLQKASGPAEEAMKGLGTSSKELGEIITTQGLDVALMKLKDGMNTLGSDAERNAALMTIFGTENSAAAGILLDNVGLFKEFHDGIIEGQQGVGAAFEQAGIRMNTAQGMINRATAWVQDVAISAFELLGSKVSAAMGVVAQVGPQVTALASIKNVIPDGVIANIGKLATSLVGALVPSLVTTSTATGAASISFTALWAAITGPVGLIIAAIVAIGVAIYALYENVEPVRTVIDQVIDVVVAGAKQVWEVIKVVGEVLWEVGKLMFEWFIMPLQIAWEVLTALLSPIFDFIGGLLSSGESAGIASGAMDLLTKAVGFVKTGLLSIKGAVRGATAALTTIKDIVFDVFRALSKLSFTDILTGIVTGDFGEVNTVLASAGSRIATSFNNGFQDAIKEGQDATGKTVESSAATTQKNVTATVKTGTKSITEEEKKRAKERQQIAAQVAKTQEEIEERIRRSQVDGVKKRTEQQIDALDEQTAKLKENYALSEEARTAALLDLETQRAALSLGLSLEAIAEEKRARLKAIADQAAEVMANEKFSGQQKQQLVAALAREQQAVELSFAEQTAQAQAERAKESEQRITEIKQAELTKRLALLDVLQKREESNLQKSLDRVTKVEAGMRAAFGTAGTRALDEASSKRLALLDAEKERALEAVGESESQRAAVEAQYAAMRSDVEAGFAAQRLILQERLRGQEILAAQMHEKKLLELQRSQLAERLALVPQDSQEALRLRQQLEDIEDTLREKSDVIGTIAQEFEQGFTESLTAMFAGDQEGMKDGMRATLATIAGYLEQLAAAAAMEIVLESPMIKGLAAVAGPAAPLVLTSISALIKAGISALLSPILSSILSFGTGGRVDDPTLAIVGDAARYAGTNTEWILRDRDIQQLAAMTVAPFTEAILDELRALRADVQVLHHERTLARGSDIMVSYDRASNAVSRRARTTRVRN